mmetsp:Transcript_21424/g.70842  ORF Transcript_21424/g.70842 Transcript_21424/m.70842 type:complete len:218 (+) Transcript_21424:71-724(+)
MQLAHPPLALTSPGRRVWTQSQPSQTRGTTAACVRERRPIAGRRGGPFPTTNSRRALCDDKALGPAAAVAKAQRAARGPRAGPPRGTCAPLRRSVRLAGLGLLAAWRRREAARPRVGRLAGDAVVEEGAATASERRLRPRTRRAVPVSVAVAVARRAGEGLADNHAAASGDGEAERGGVQGVLEMVVKEATVEQQARQHEHVGEAVEAVARRADDEE